MTDRTPQGLHPFRYLIEATLEAQSHLHVGTGEAVPDVLPKRPDDDVSPLLARVVRDVSGGFFLPGSTLKNLLRRAEPDEFLARCLFGTVLNGDRGRMGSVFVWGAPCTYAGPPGEGPGAAILGDAFIAARTAIDRKLGSAAEHRLFFQEMVPAGSRFGLRLLVVGDDADSAESRAIAVLTILRRLEEGSTIGKGQADGLGRVCIVEDSLSCNAGRIGMDGTLTWTPAAHLIPESVNGMSDIAEGMRETLKLRCEGPFMVVDSSRVRNESAALKRDQAHLKAQRLRERMPLLLGTSVMGVLRSRAAWLAALEGKSDDPHGKVSRTRESANELSPVERLFGVAGFRGLLALEKLEVEAEETWDTLTSVKLDRFSGAPIDGGLFTSAVFVGVELTLTLVLQDRSFLFSEHGHKAGEPTLADVELFNDLIQDINRNGLMLGHATNRGFGWFDCVEAAQ